MLIGGEMNDKWEWYAWMENASGLVQGPPPWQRAFLSGPVVIIGLLVLAKKGVDCMHTNANQAFSWNSDVTIHAIIME